MEKRPSYAEASARWMNSYLANTGSSLNPTDCGDRGSFITTDLSISVIRPRIGPSPAATTGPSGLRSPLPFGLRGDTLLGNVPRRLVPPFRNTPKGNHKLPNVVSQQRFSPVGLVGQRGHRQAGSLSRPDDFYKTPCRARGDKAAARENRRTDVPEQAAENVIKCGST